MRNAAVVLLGLVLAAPAASADPACRAVEVRFAPGAPELQIAVWIETADGKYVDTAYVTRLTGQFGLANRPGSAFLKTDFRWPYGRRDMVLPVWAHRRNHQYPLVVMGGVCGNSVSSTCPDNSGCGGDCLDTTIAYHPRVSSYEPFYCSPSGASQVDALSCASRGSFSKGAFAPAPAYSLYPPRADLTSFEGTDSPDARRFAALNDLVAISRATPVGGKAIEPAITWYSPGTPDGDYVVWVELSQEADFNTSHHHPNVADSVQAWDFEGHDFLGQPSIVYKAAFHLGPQGTVTRSSDYAGYGAWDGASGTLLAPDATITTDKPGSGARRLLDQGAGGDAYRLQVAVGACGAGDGGTGCQTPDKVTSMKVTAPSASEIDVEFVPPQSGAPPSRYEVRYLEGGAAITDATFDRALSAPEVVPGSDGAASLTARISGLKPSTTYSVAVRAMSACNQGSVVEVGSATTPAQTYTTLNGCFIATAAYGSPLDRSVGSLRTVRDHRLLTNAAGRLLVAGYYAFSPPLARVIERDERLRAAARALLTPLVDLVTRQAPRAMLFR